MPVRVRGTLVDARTGAPVEGATLLTLYDPEIVSDAERLEERRSTGRMYEEAAAESRGRLCYGFVGSAHTDALGAFEIVVGISTSVRTGASGITWSRERGSAFRVARALLVEKEGYVPLVHETKDARWLERQEGRIVGTLEVGTIRLAPAPPVDRLPPR